MPDAAPFLSGFASIVSSYSLFHRSKSLLDRAEASPLPSEDRSLWLEGAAAALSPAALRTLSGALGEPLAKDGAFFRLPKLQSETDSKAWAPFIAAADSLAQTLASLPEARLEALANALADNLCLPFERDGEPCLAFPAASSGLRLGRSKGPDGKMLPTVSGWRSTLPDRLRKLASPVRGDQALEGLPLESPLRLDLEGLSAERSAPLRESLSGDRFSLPSDSWAGKEARSLFLDGVHLAEAFPRLGGEGPLPSASAYAPLPSAAEPLFSEGSIPLAFSSARFRALEAHAPALLAQALGDAPPDPMAPASALAHPKSGAWAKSAFHFADPQWKEKSRQYHYQSVGDNPHANFQAKTSEQAADLALKAAKIHPAGSLVQIARFLAERIPPAPGPFANREWARSGQHVSLPDSPDLPSIRKRAASCPPALAALRLQIALDSASGRLVSRAVEIASQRQERWLESVGFLEAWRHCSASATPSGFFTSKDLAWAKATPGLAASAALPPYEAFLLSASRSLGVSPSAPDLPKACEEALASSGATPEALAALRESDPLREALGRAFSAIALTKGVAREAARSRLRNCLECANAAGALGPSHFQAAAEAAGMILSCSDDRPFRSLDGCEPLAASTRPRKVSDPSEASALLASARAKAQAYPMLIRSLVEEHEQARGMLGADPSAPLDPAALASLSERFALGASAFSARVKAESRAEGFRSVPADIDWPAELALGPRWSRCAGLGSPSLDASIAAASRDPSPACQIAARLAKDLGVEEASGPNDLVARCKGALRDRLGLSEAAWKTLLKSGPAASELLCSSLRAAGSLQRTLAEPSFDEIRRSLNAESETREAAASLFAPHAAAAALQAAASFGFPPEYPQAALECLLFSGIILSKTGQGELGPRDYALPAPALSLFAPPIAPMRLDSADGAEFFLREAQAKADRIPFVWKALFESAKAKSEALASDPEALAAAEEAWKKHRRSFRSNRKPAARSPLELAMFSSLSDLQLVSDWVEGSEAGFWQALPERPSWGALWRGQRGWHAEEDFARRQKAELSAAKGKNPTSGAHWGSFLKTFRDGEWEAVDLSCAADLKAEGEAMSHCVSSYSSNCRSGESRILSIRLGGSRVATLQLQPFRGKSPVSWAQADESCEWRAVQNRGRFNAAVSDKAALAFCEKTRLAYSQAHAEGIRKSREAAAKKRSETLEGIRIKVGEEAMPEAAAPQKPARARKP